MKRLERVTAKYRKEVNTQLKAISRTIQARREVMRLTQEKLAEELDISAVTLKTIEQNRRYPSLPMLFYICSYLDLKIQIKK